MTRCGCAALACVTALLAVRPTTAREPEVLRSIDAIPANIAGRFRNPIGFQQAASGQYFVFDRRDHTIYGINEEKTAAWEIVRIGPEQGRIIDPTAFSVLPDGRFLVADTPNGKERIQIFTATGMWLGVFPMRARPTRPLVLGDVVVNGIGSIQYTGGSFLISEPDTGGLFSEYSLIGGATRSIGDLRRTGHESDRALHLALNSGLPLVDPRGGYFFVFQTGEPIFRKYDESGKLVFERHIEGREIDPVINALPTVWPRRKAGDEELPLVEPTVRTAAVDPSGNLWISFAVPYTYVYDRDGDKQRTLQFRAAGVISPSSFFFGSKGRLLVTPGLYEFESKNSP